MKPKIFFWGGTLGLLAGALAYLARPAALKSASITATTPGNPPTASVALDYGGGALPAHVIVDLRDGANNGGSATVDGKQLFLEVPLAGTLGDGCSVTVTASYRLLSRPYI